MYGLLQSAIDRGTAKSEHESRPSDTSGGDATGFDERKRSKSTGATTMDSETWHSDEGCHLPVSYLEARCFPPFVLLGV